MDSRGNARYRHQHGGGADHWLSYEYVRDPRHALEPDNAQQACCGAQHVLNLLVPHPGAEPASAFAWSEQRLQQRTAGRNTTLATTLTHDCVDTFFRTRAHTNSLPTSVSTGPACMRVMPSRCRTRQRVVASLGTFHNGHFKKRHKRVCLLGAWCHPTNKATCIYANYLEPSERVGVVLFSEVAELAQAQAEQHLNCPNAWYWQVCPGALQPGHQCRQGPGLGAGQYVSRQRWKTILPTQARRMHIWLWLLFTPR